MALKQPALAPDDRLKGHQTTYSSTRGGHYPSQPKPVPGKPK
ncbi:hypothetical protein [Streptomyces lavendulocolor]